MTSKSDRFRTDLLAAVEELLKRSNFEDRSENELDAYLNRIIEDFTHDFDRFARKGLVGTEKRGAVERDKRMKEDRVKASMVSLLSRSNLADLDERRIRDIKDDLERAVVKTMGRLGVQPADGFVGETAEDLIEMLHKKDWLIQHVLMTLGSYSLSDLTSNEIRELHTEIEGIVKSLEK